MDRFPALVGDKITGASHPGGPTLRHTSIVPSVMGRRDWDYEFVHLSVASRMLRTNTIPFVCSSFQRMASSRWGDHSTRDELMAERPNGKNRTRPRKSTKVQCWQLDFGV